MNARQNDLGGTTMGFVRCGRCHKPLKVAQSVLRGYGPVCWGKIEGDYERDRLEALPRTITDQKKAAVSLYELRQWIMEHLTSDHCFCGKPFADCELETYDYGDSKSGYALDGFRYRQWVYLHCSQCKNDTAIWKILQAGPHLTRHPEWFETNGN